MHARLAAAFNRARRATPRIRFFHTHAPVNAAFAAGRFAHPATDLDRRFRRGGRFRNDAEATVHRLRTGRAPMVPRPVL